jgi:fructose-1,6-bisphosphatase/sedoheptulose 1,7-bisphosphatase-like protein
MQINNKVISLNERSNIIDELNNKDNYRVAEIMDNADIINNARLLPIVSLKDVKAVALKPDLNLHRIDANSKYAIYEKILMPIFVQVTSVGALSVKQMVGHGLASKKVIDFRGMVGVHETLKNISRIIPVNFHIVNGEGQRDESFGLAHGDVIYCQDAFTPVQLKNYPIFAKLLEDRGVDPALFDDLPPLNFKVIVDVVDGTTFTAKAADRGTSIITFALMSEAFKNPIMAIPDGLLGYIRAVAYGLEGVDTDPRREIKYFVRDVAISKLIKRGIGLDSDNKESLIAKEIKKLKVIIMNRPQNKYLIEEYKKAGIKVELEEGTENIKFKSSRIKGKQYSLISGNLSAVGDGSISVLQEADIFDGSAGATESGIMAHMAEDASIIVVDRKILDADVKAGNKRALPDLIDHFYKYQEQPTQDNLKNIYKEEALAQFAEVGLTRPEQFARILKKEDMISSPLTMTFYSAITRLTGENTPVVAGVEANNPNAYFGIKGMDGASVDPSSYDARTSSIAVGHNGQPILIQSTYKTKTALLAEAIEKKQAELAATQNEQRVSKETLVLVSELVKVYKDFIANLSYLGLTDQLITVFDQLEKLLAIIAESDPIAGVTKVWIFEYKNHLKAFEALKQTANLYNDLDQKLAKYKHALEIFEELSRFSHILNYYGYDLELRTMIADIKKEIKGIEKKMAPAK